ncbi:MAG: DNA polymerase III subunit delta, partial [Pseudomonadales bacterium]|nr:DNA polymerase III subunit delta [Pseudomonadales bacterium]
DDEVLQLLIERTEGNLLAAAQEVDKLRLLNGPGTLDRETLRNSTADSARYDVYELAEAALSGQTHRAIRMLDQRLEEGEAPSLILFPLINDLRTLLQAQFMVQQGVAPAVALTRAGAWSSRQPTLQPALRRLGPRTLQALMNLAHDIDRSIKGRSDNSPIDGLRRLIAALSGRPLFRNSAVVR